MKKPKLEIDIESKVAALTQKLINEKRKEILLYCFMKLGKSNFLHEKLYMEPEKVDFFSIKILTFRYDGELLFREFPAGSSLRLLNKKYELAERFR